MNVSMTIMFNKTLETKFYIYPTTETLNSQSVQYGITYVPVQIVHRTEKPSI